MRARGTDRAIQAITFDVGGTLMEPWPSVGHVYVKVAERHGVRGLQAEQLTERFASAWKARKDFNYSKSDWAEIVDATFHGLSKSPPSQTFFSELYNYFAQPESWRVFPDVLPTLDGLASEGMKLGVISNWDERLRPLLSELRLDRYFETIVVSCEVGFAKPSPVIFEIAAEKLCRAAGSILHVGDSPDLDADGARAAGFQSCLLRRGNGSSLFGEISELQQLLEEAG
jgi:putative hydrolase of the HAD superfamily